MNATPKLEIKHISPYLPYGLTVHSDYNNRTEKIVGMCQYVDSFEIKTVDATKDNPVIWSWKVGEFRPFLRPLSDLTKDELIPIGLFIRDINKTVATYKDNIFAIEDAKAWIRGGMKPVLSLEQSKNIIEYLFSIHADLNNLLDQNLAIPK